MSDERSRDDRWSSRVFFFSKEMNGSSMRASSLLSHLLGLTRGTAMFDLLVLLDANKLAACVCVRLIVSRKVEEDDEEERGGECFAVVCDADRLIDKLSGCSCIPVQLVSEDAEDAEVVKGDLLLELCWRIASIE